jgi:hypothetical protein
MRTEKTQENVEVEKEMVNVEITIYTDRECEKGDHNEYARIRIERSCMMASCLFHLIELSCINYTDMMIGEVDSEFAHRHLESIRTVAELGKQLAYQI